MKIFVTGGFSRSRPEDEASVRTLGRTVASAGHTLLQGYLNAFDQVIAQAAFEVAKEDRDRFPDRRCAVQSFITQDQDPPEHVPWLVRRLPMRDWIRHRRNGRCRSRSNTVTSPSSWVEGRKLCELRISVDLP